MKKIMLMAVNAKYIHSNLAVYSLRSNAGRYREQIVLGEYTINQQEDEILENIWRMQPDILFVSCYIWNISYIKQILKDVHTILPHVPIWVGGPEVSYDAADFLRENPHVTGVLKGEGEDTFPEVLDCYYGQKNPETVSGITYRVSHFHKEAATDFIQENPWREVLPMDTLVFPYGNLQDFKNRIIYYESSRGCPFSCSYCLSSVDKKLRFRKIELVEQELQFFLDQKVPQVKFVDRTFNCAHSHAKAIWRYILKHDNGITNFHFEVAADLLDEEELALIRQMRPGLIQLEIGVQSTNSATIAEIHRKMNFQKVSAVVQQVQSFQNTHLHLDLIAGLPCEGYESFRTSFNDVYRLQPEQLQLGFLKVLKGSYMHKMADSYGCCYKGKEPYEVLVTNWLTYEEIIRLKQVESMVEVYYNSRQFSYTLSRIEPYYENMFDFYQALGCYYERKGYSQISHSRLRRYEILLDFLAEENLELQEEIAQWMTRDLYRRENLKSRPSWMKDDSPWQKAIREYIRLHGLPKTVHIEVYAEETILYDYERRNPLTYNVEEERIDLDINLIR